MYVNYYASVFYNCTNLYTIQYVFGTKLLLPLQFNLFPFVFFLNVTTLRSGICYHKSVCLSSGMFVQDLYAKFYGYRPREPLR